MTPRRYRVKAKRVRVKQRKKLSLFEIVKQLLEYTSSIDIPQRRSYDEEKILLSCLQFIVKKLEKKNRRKKSQFQNDIDEHFTEEVSKVDKATNTPVNKHIRFESSSSEDDTVVHSEHEEQVSINENERMKIRKTYNKQIELLHDKIRRQCNEIKEGAQRYKGMTTNERNTMFVTSTILMAIVTSSWLYFVIYSNTVVSEEQGNLIFSNIITVQIMFIVLSVKYCI